MDLNLQRDSSWDSIFITIDFNVREIEYILHDYSSFLRFYNTIDTVLRRSKPGKY